MEMEKINYTNDIIKNLSIIFHCNMDHPDRLSCLHLCLDYLNYHLPDATIFFGEQFKDEPKMKEVKNKCIYIPFKWDTEYYDRARVINSIVLNHVKTPVICVCDLDQLMNPDAYYEATHILMKSNFFDIIFGSWCDHFYDVQEEHKEILRKNIDKNLDDLFKGVEFPDRHSCNLGSPQFFKVESYKKFGMENPYQKCVGFEDSEKIIRFRVLKWPKSRYLKDDNDDTKYRVYHLTHYRGPLCCENSPYFYDVNIPEGRKVESMNKKELEDYIENWRQYFLTGI